MAKALHAQRYKGLPDLLRTMRQQAGLTQRELAKKLRLTHSLVHNCETAERRIDVAEFVDWATACDVDPVEALKKFLRQR